MSFFEFPHTRTYDSDLGWLIQFATKYKEYTENLLGWKQTHEAEYEQLENTVEGLINSLVDVIVPWDSSIAYHIFSIVEYQGQNYIAIQDVPVGVMITNTSYWQPAATAIQQINAIGITVDEIKEQIPYVTPEMYGAVGDGLTDDTAAVQEAIDTGKTVLLSQTYLVTSVGVESYRYIQGVNGAVLKSAGTAITAANDDTYMHDVLIRDVTIEAGTGIDFSNRTHDIYKMTIEGVVFNCNDYAIKSTKSFQWRVVDCWIEGTYGFVGIQGPGNTFENIYERDCLHMFVNCDGVFININCSNSQRTLSVFEYNDSNYGHDVTIIGANFERVQGTLITNTNTCGFSCLYMIGVTVINCPLDDYLFVIHNPGNLTMWFAQVVLDASRTKFINIASGYSAVKSMSINSPYPFAIAGYEVRPPVQGCVVPAGSYYPQMTFAGVRTPLLSGAVSPIQEDIALASAVRFSDGSLVNLTAGTGSTLGRVLPPASAITGQVYIQPGTVITVKNSTGASLTVTQGTTTDYGFEEAATLADGEAVGYILLHNGSNLQWHKL